MTTPALKSDKRPLRILLSEQCAQRLAPRIGDALGGRSHEIVLGGDADIAFVSRDVTGLSTKHEILPPTQAFYDAMEGAPSLRWAHAHSAGADRAIYGLLRARGVTVTTSAGANAGVVAQTALAGILSLARHFPLLAQAQRERRWAPLIQSGLPRDLAGQVATIVGWGAIGQKIGQLLHALDLEVIAVRQSRQASPPARQCLSFSEWKTALPRTDWLILACPLTDITRGLVDADALSLLPPSAHLVNVARGEVVDETALCMALDQGRLAGACLDVFAHEPLPANSPLWDLRNVIVTPHSAGFSDGNGDRVARIFLDNLARWENGQALINVVT